MSVLILYLFMLNAPFLNIIKKVLDGYLHATHEGAILYAKI